MKPLSAISTASTPFGYICHRCSRCCRHKHIQLDPYEIARLASARDETTTAFIARWTVGGRGTHLRQKEDGTCVFLGAEGCTVHADRPLVCRLYPLGRHVTEDGFEYFKKSGDHPLSAGEYTDRGTIADYLEAQGARPFMAAGDEYFRWFCAAYRKLNATDDELLSRPAGDAEDCGLLDMDRMIADHCAASGEAEPESLDERHKLHVKLLYAALDSMENDDATKTANLSEDTV